MKSLLPEPRRMELQRTRNAYKQAADTLRDYIRIGAHQDVIRAAAKTFLSAASDFGYAENRAQAARVQP
jgi:hypothetical protein